MKELPKIYKTKVSNANNRSAFYSLNNEKIDIKEKTPKLHKKINLENVLKNTKNGYSKEITIVLEDRNIDTRIVTKTNEYILTIDNEKIYFNEIKDIIEK